jgi:hypothetical protein
MADACWADGADHFVDRRQPGGARRPLHAELEQRRTQLPAAALENRGQAEIRVLSAARHCGDCMPVQTIEDGATLRVLVLPSSGPPPSLPAPAAGRELVMLDFVIENLQSTQGIDFTTSQQLRLIDSAGAYVQPSTLTKRIGCRLDDGDVIPHSPARRFQVVYETAAGEPKRLQCRGFEVDEISVDIP